MARRRFLILTQYYPPEVGAAQVRLSAVARQLRALGHDVEVVTAMPNYPTGRVQRGYRRRVRVHEVIEGVPVTRVWLYASVGRGMKRLASYLSFSISAILGLLGRRRPDVVFVETPPLFVVVTAALAARMWRAMLVVNVSDLWPDAVVDLGAISEGRALRLAKRFERWCYARATIINAVTDGIADAIGNGRAPAAKLRTLPNGVDVELFRPDAGRPSTLKALGLDGDGLFLFTGNLGLAQGLENVVRAAHIAASHEPSVTLAFLGDGSNRLALEALCTELGTSNVKFLDPVPLETVAEVLSLATAVVVSLARMPTNEGARPSKIFPALAAGRPVLYAGEGEGARLVAEANAGLIVPNDDVDGLADAMLVLTRDRSLGDRLGANGRRLAEDRFSWASLVASWVETLP